MSIELTTLLFFGALLFFLVLGLPLTFVLGGVSVVFLYFTWGIDSFYLVASQIWGTMESFTLGCELSSAQKAQLLTAVQTAVRTQDIHSYPHLLK